MGKAFFIALFALPAIGLCAEIIIGAPEESGCAPIGIG